MFAYLILFLLFFLPFVVFPVGSSPFEYPKVIAAEVIIALLIALRFFRAGEYSVLLSLKRVWRTKQLYPRRNLPSAYLLLGFGALCILTYLLHPSTLALFGNSFRGQGALLFLLLLVFSFLSGKVRVPRLSPWIIAALLGIQVFLSLVIADKDGRAVGIIGEPNSLAAYAVSLWAFVLYSDKKKVVSEKKRITRLAYWMGIGVSLSSTIFLIIFSGSRSGLIALCLQLIFLCTARFLSFFKTSIIIILLFTFFLSLPLFDTKTMYENRGEIWRTGLIAGYEHPIVGYGFGNTEVAFKDYNMKLYNRLRGYYVDSSHNIFLDMWIQGGIIGVSLFLLLLFENVRNFIRSKNHFALLLFIGLITCLSFNPLSSVILVQFWWLMGYARTSQNNPSTG